MNTQGFTTIVLAVEVEPVSYRMVRQTARCGRARGAAASTGVLTVLASVERLEPTDIE